VGSIRCVHEHVSRPEQRRAGVAARDRDHRRHHQVLDEGARDDDLDGVPVALGNLDGDVVGIHSVTVDGESFCRDSHLLVLLPDVSLVAKEVEASVAARHVRLVLHGRAERLARGDVHVAVHLLVVDDDVEVLRGEVDGLALVDLEGLGRGHAVELADLGGALEHLDGVGVCGKGGGNA
jgi:hypothetical protein